MAQKQELNCPGADESRAEFGALSPFSVTVFAGMTGSALLRAVQVLELPSTFPPLSRNGPTAGRPGHPGSLPAEVGHCRAKPERVMTPDISGAAQIPIFTEVFNVKPEPASSGSFEE
jgi:hypothetical protein